jgi:AcrR family transcriptional regulator
MGAVTLRARFRAQVRDEIKQIALRQLAELGPAGISVNAIGKELGVTGPALYRYFASRDELLTELAIDSYDDLAAAVGTAVDATPARATRRRLEVLARSHRDWARDQPHRYRLLYAPPIPGYEANAERLVDAAQAS